MTTTPDPNPPTPKKDPYILSRTLCASTRLNYQFYLWQSTLPFTIHPSIPLPPTPTIADIATGTGLWLLSLLPTHPTAHLYGYDINLLQTPIAEHLPENVTFGEWDVFDEFEGEMKGCFDLVHVRLLGLVVQGRGGRVAAGEVWRRLWGVVGEGGWVQWEELDEMNASIFTRGKTSSNKKPKSKSNSNESENDNEDEDKDNDANEGKTWKELMSWQNTREGSDWPSKLAEEATKAGFEEATLYRFVDRKEMGRAHMEAAMMFFREYVEGMEGGGREEEAARWRDILVKAEKEVLEGTVVSIPKVVCVARKPVGAGSSRAPG